MKFVIPYAFVNKLDQECNVLFAVNICPYKGVIRKADWGNFWMFEADDTYPLICVLKDDFQPLEILDDEYRQIMADGTAFTCKSRRKQIAARNWWPTADVR